MAAKKPLQDPAVPDGAVDGINPADPSAYKGFNFDMGTPTHNITCNSCHAGGGAAEFGRENKPLDEVLKERLGEDLFNELKTKDWFIRDDQILAQINSFIPFDGDLFGYSDYEVGAGYIGKPGLFNFARSGVNDTDCFMCHSKADADSKIKTEINGYVQQPIMPSNPRVMVFRGISSDGETIVLSLGIPPKVGEKVEVGKDQNGNPIYKTVAKVDSAYYNSVPLSVLKALYHLSDDQLNAIRSNDGSWSKFFIYPNNANGATREVARVAYFEHPSSTADKDGGDVYVNGGAATFHDDNGNVVYRTFAGFFFKYISTADLMGVDTDHDGVPLAYVRFVKEDGVWKPEVYYEKDEFNSKGEVDLPILENRIGDKDTPSTEVPPGNYNYSVPAELGSADNPYPKMTKPAEGSDANRDWGYVCSYCHMAIPYKDGKLPDGSDTYAWVTRKGTLGLAAEIVKRGDVFSYDIHRGSDNGENLEPTELQQTLQSQGFDAAYKKMITAKSVLSINDDIPIGYDVHFDSKEGAGLTCLSCHGEGTLSPEEKQYHPIHHDFLKGNDWGGHWDQSLDYNPSLKTCLDCHFGGSRQLAAEVHRSAFGPGGNAAIHMDKVACEVCHIPFKTHWTFRTFYDVVGYSYNFDNRILNYDLANEKVQKLPEKMFVPGFGPFMPIAGYGAPQPFCIARTDNGKDTVVPIYQADFDPRQAALRLENKNFGIWNVPDISFPWAWAPVIINNGFRPDTPGGQKFMYRLADPLTLVTWYDKSTGKVLYTREIAAAIDGEVKSNYAGKNVPAYYIENGKICVKTIKGAFICDDNGDLLPEIDTDAEYEAMRNALIDVLKKEGIHNPDPVFYIWTAPFSIDHGVLPKEYALGAGATVNGEKLNCDACHNAKTGRLPEANMSDIQSSSALSSLIKKDANGHIKFFGLGREIVTVPSAIPPEAYKNAVRVFFNSPEDDNGNPVYGSMTIKVAGHEKNIKVMYTTAGDILVNALANGIDIDRHLVPIPVESSGIDGVAFALPGKESSWKMKIEGVEAEVETEALEDDEVPRRAIVYRLKNEMTELLGFEHLADEIMSAGSPDLVPVFTPVIPSEYITKMDFNLSDLKVADPADLYINYARIHKVRVSKGSEVYYELDKENFKPASISVKDAILKGWASYDPAEGVLTVNTAAMAEEVPGEGELAFSIMRKTGAEVTVPSEIEIVNKSSNKVELNVAISGEKEPVTVTTSTKDVVISDVLEPSQLLRFASEHKLKKVVLGVELLSDKDSFSVEFDVDGLVDPNKAVAYVTVNGKTESCKPQLESGVLKVDYPCSGTRTLTRAETPITVVLGETESTPTATSGTVSGGGGGGGCSVAPSAPAGNGLLNLGVLLSGLLGLFGFRRKKH